MQASYRDPKRPKMVQWRWNLLPPTQIDKSVFKGLNIENVKFDSQKIETLFSATASNPSDKLKSEKRDNLTKTREEKTQPVLLNHQRCQIVEIIKKRFAEPPSLIKKFILDVNLEFLTPDTISELISLFPKSSYDIEVDLFAKYDKPKETLSEAEQFLFIVIIIIYFFENY